MHLDCLPPNVLDSCHLWSVGLAEEVTVEVTTAALPFYEHKHVHFLHVSGHCMLRSKADH